MVDSANLTERINTITSLQGYVYRLWRYDVSHSVLTIRAVDPDDKKPCVLITFNFVTYLLQFCIS